LAWEEIGAKIGKMEGGGEANRSAGKLAKWADIGTGELDWSVFGAWFGFTRQGSTARRLIF